MKSRLSLIGASLCLGLLGSPAFAAGDETTVQDCWLPAFEAGDANAVSQCYADDAVLWLPGGPTLAGRAAIRDGYEDFFAHFSIRSMTLESSGHQELGDNAASWGTFRLVMVSRDDGKEVVEVGRYTDISRFEDGHWVYVVDHASDDPAAPPSE